MQMWYSSRRKERILSALICQKFTSGGEWTEDAFCGCKRNLIVGKRHEYLQGMHPRLHLL